LTTNFEVEKPDMSILAMFCPVDTFQIYDGPAIATAVVLSSETWQVALTAQQQHRFGKGMA